MRERFIAFAFAAGVLALAAVPFVAEAGETWRGLVVAPEHRCAPYDKRSQYPYPASIEPRIVDRQAGLVYGPYTGRLFASIDETDIEHMVATAEAHDSGLCAASAETRARFAVDLDNLTLAGPRVNRHEKGGKDAGEWLPAEGRCWFARRVVAVKRKYSLTVDRREASALEGVIETCGEERRAKQGRTP